MCEEQVGDVYVEPEVGDIAACWPNDSTTPLVLDMEQCLQVKPPPATGSYVLTVYHM